MNIAHSVPRYRSKLKLLYLPYVHGVSKRIVQGCKNLGVRPVFKSGQTLRQILTHVKSTIPEDRKQGIVYEVPCKDYEAVYRGETGRNLQERAKEHKYVVKRWDENNDITIHTCNTITNLKAMAQADKMLYPNIHTLLSICATLSVTTTAVHEHSPEMLSLMANDRLNGLVNGKKWLMNLLPATVEGCIFRIWVLQWHSLVQAFITSSSVSVTHS